MNFVFFTPAVLTIGACVYYFKKEEKCNINEDIELISDHEYDDDCPIIFFDNNGNYYYVYK